MDTWYQAGPRDTQVIEIWCGCNNKCSEDLQITREKQTTKF